MAQIMVHVLQISLGIPQSCALLAPCLWPQLHHCMLLICYCSCCMLSMPASCMAACMMVQALVSTCSRFCAVVHIWHSLRFAVLWASPCQPCTVNPVQSVACSTQRKDMLV